MLNHNFPAIMYQLVNLHKLVCSPSSFIGSFIGCGYNGNIGNVWKIPFKQSFYKFLKISHEKLSCDDFFLFCYWFCLIFAVVGFLEAVIEFVRVYSDDKYNPTTFWNRNYKHIPYEFQRAGRMLGTVFNIVSSFGQIYGYTNFRGSNLLPWIIINTFVVSLEIIYWIINGFVSKTFKLTPMKSIIVLMFRVALTTHVMMIMKRSRF